MLALLNQEIHMLEPILLSIRGPATWIETTDPNVKAAVLRSDKGVLVLPIWLGSGSQYVPPHASVQNLTIIVPLIPDGARPWEISPTRVQSLEYNAERKIGGTRIVIPEFDLTAAIVFTSDFKGRVGDWQTHSRQVAPMAAQWAHDLAAIQLQKVRKTHAELVGLAPPVAFAAAKIRESEDRLESCSRFERAHDYANAHLEAIRAMRPLRIVMRTHWEQAAKSLEVATASPYAASFFTLPRHWELHRELKATTVGANALPSGDFEGVSTNPAFMKAAEIVEGYRKIGSVAPVIATNPANPANRNATNPTTPKSATPTATNPNLPNTLGNKSPSLLGRSGEIVTSNPNNENKELNEAGVPVATLPGWEVQQQTLDPVNMTALLVPSQFGKLDKPDKPKPKKNRWDPSTGPIPPIEPREPKLGECILKMEIKPKVVLSLKDKKPRPAPAALERTYLAVSSPAVHLQPGTWVRISGWVLVAGSIVSSADGFLLFDNVGEEAMGVRITSTGPWQQFHLYRQVPASGVIWVTAALTGVGLVYVDDLMIEPLLKSSTASSAAAPVSTVGTMGELLAPPLPTAARSR